MKKCIQFTLNGEKFQFDIEIKKESDLLAPFSDIINNYILKNKDNSEKWKELNDKLKEDYKESVPKELFTKDNLTDADISYLLRSYSGNTNIYNLAAFFNTYRQSNRLNALRSIFNSSMTYKYDTLLIKGAKNRLILNADKNLLIINPDSTDKELSNLYGIIYTIEQLKNPQSLLFKDICTILRKSKEYQGDGINKVIYNFLNNNLEYGYRIDINNAIIKDINTKINALKVIEDINSSQSDLLETLFNIEDINLNENVTLKQIIAFKSGLYKTTNPENEEELKAKFIETFNIEGDIDEKLYPKRLWKYFIDNKNIAELLFEEIQKNKPTINKNKTILDVLSKICDNLIINNIKFKNNYLHWDWNFDISNVFVEPNSNFYHSKMVKLITSNPFNTLVITKRDKKFEFQGTETFKYSNLNVIKEKLNKNKKINYIYLDGNYSKSELDNIINSLDERITTIALNTFDSDMIIYLNNQGFNVNIYQKEYDSNLITELSQKIPIYKSPLGFEYRVRSEQLNIFDDKLTKGESLLIPVNNSDNIVNIPKDFSFRIYNKNKNYGVLLKDKINLYHTYNKEIGNNLIPGTLFVNKGKKYIFIKNIEENKAQVFDLNGQEPIISEIILDSNIQFMQNGYIIRTPINENNIFWIEHNGINYFYDSDLNVKTKSDYFENLKPKIKESTGINNDILINKLINSNLALFEIVPNGYIEKSEIIYNEQNYLRYYTNKEMLERIKQRLGNKVPIIWFREGDPDINPKLWKEKAFTSEGIIYLNEKGLNPSSFIHELSHIMIAYLRVTKPEAYNELISQIENIPEEFKEKYSDLTYNDLREEYLINEFAKNFTEFNEDAVYKYSDIMDWDILKTMFKLPKDLETDDLYNMMASGLNEFLKFDKFDSIETENKFKNITKLAAVKRDLMLRKNPLLIENCK